MILRTRLAAAAVITVVGPYGAALRPLVPG